MHRRALLALLLMRVRRLAALALIAAALVGPTLALPAAPSADDLTSSDFYSWIFAVGSAGQIIKSSDAGASVPAPSR